MPKLSDMHRTPTHPPLAYFITVRTYGTWLHGDDRGSVDRHHHVYGQPKVEANPQKSQSERGRLKHPPTVFTAQAAAVVEQTIHEVCAHRGWTLLEAKARTNHFHAIVTAPVTAERVMNDLKAWATRRLRESGLVAPDQEVWAQHGSTPHLWTTEQVAAAIEYVRTGQGPPLAPQNP
jgi:REP element-mobilizing transposase RayT